MNNDQCIVIKSLPQPDGGEGASEWQGMRGNVHSEESHSENAGRCTRSKLGEPKPGRVCNTRRSPLSIVWQGSIDLTFAHGKYAGLPRESHGVSGACSGLEPSQEGSTASGKSAEDV